MIDARPASGRRLEWQVAVVCDIAVETPRVKTFVVRVDGWQGHSPGQHVDIRLTSEDGYQAQRSYSIASPPEDELIALTVVCVDDGEVSPYLHRDLRRGDKFELRGPIGGYFVWTTAAGGPVQLIGGGSGVAPLMAMLRHRERRDHHERAMLLYSSRSVEEIIYREELAAMAGRDPDLRIIITLTSQQPERWAGYGRRIDKAMLADVCFPPETNPRSYVCGPTPFVESAAQFLVELGHDPLSIKTERFGPTGG